MVLADTGSTRSLITDDYAKKQRLQMDSSTRNLSMDSSSLNSPVKEHCTKKLNLLGKSNPKTRLLVLTDIRCDVILDRDFMCQHSEALFTFGVTKKSLHISNFSS